MVGCNILSQTWSGVDSLAHLSEEVPNPAVTVPKAMILAQLFAFFSYVLDTVDIGRTL
jgi:amino acid transporter